MSIWHTPAEGLKGGIRTGRFSVVPRRDRVLADGSIGKTTGFQITLPRNGILNTERLSPLEIQQAETALGEDWPAKLDAWLERHHRLLGLEKGDFVDIPPVKVDVERPDEVVAGTDAILTRVRGGGRSLTGR